MAGTKYDPYSTADTDPTNLMAIVGGITIGYHEVTLTEYTTTTIPQIAAGSKIEISGSFYRFDSNETLTGSPSDGSVYIYIVPSTITAVMTNTVPTWSDSKQGLYDSTETYRYLNIYMAKSGASYTKYSLPFAKSTDAAVGADGSIIANGGFFGDLTGGIVIGSSMPKFYAYKSSDVAASENGTIIFDTEIFDIGSGYNSSTGVFTAPLNGYYQFQSNVDMYYNSGTWSARTAIIKNKSGSSIQVASAGYIFIPTTYDYSFNSGCLINMSAGDTMEVIAKNLGGLTPRIYGGIDPAKVNFSGFLIV